MMKRLVIAFCVVTFLTLATISGIGPHKVAAQKQDERWMDVNYQFAPNRILVKFGSTIMPDHARNIIAALGARDAEEIPGTGVHILELPDQATEHVALHAFQARPEVDFAELDRLVKPDDVIPNDPWYVDQWHLTKISGPTAWSTTTGSASVIIAILDTGVDGAHPDLSQKMVAGWNVYNNNSDSSDIGGHGTKVAGTAAAISNNANGVASVAWACKIMPVRVSDSTGYALFSDMAKGLTWAADHGARVANLSYTASDSSTVKSAASYFQSKGGVVAVSAGNDSTFSSAADNPYTLTVSATDNNDLLATFSNTGNNVDLAAPGIMIQTTAKGGGYQSVAGTSFSAPIVAGVAALVMSANASLSPAQVQDILKQSADDLGNAGWDASYGWGRVNAGRAVALAGGGVVDNTPPQISFASPADGAALAGIITIGVSANDNVGVASVSLTIDGVALGTDSSSPYAFTWDTTTATNGWHTVIAVASDAMGNSSSSAITVLVSNSAPPVDTTAPTVTISSPAEGGKVSGNASVYVDASDNLGVTRNELYVDGALVASSTTAPFTTKWNTAKAKTGKHVLQCKAFDAAGNAGLSPIVNVYK